METLFFKLLNTGPAGEEVFVNGEGVVKEEMVEVKDEAKGGGLEEDPLQILPKEMKGEGLVKEEVIEIED